MTTQQNNNVSLAPNHSFQQADPIETEQMGTLSLEESAIARSIQAPTDFNSRLQACLPFMDPDSSRFAEWLWSIRVKLNKITVTEQIHYSSNTGITMADAQAMLKQFFPLHYYSAYTFRAYVDGNDGTPSLYVVAGINSGAPLILLTGDEDKVAEVVNAFKEKFKEPKCIKVKELIAISDDGPAEQEFDLIENQVLMAHDDFYPNLPMNIAELAKQYSESKANVLLLIGPPGTGKSVLLRTLIMEMNRKKVGVCSNAQSLQHPALSGWIQQFRNGGLIAIEDADILVESRDKGNHQMSMLLNYAEGILSSDSKMIISTNLPSTKNVDSALLRPGRAFMVLEFHGLDEQEGNAARTAIGLAPIDYADGVKTHTLAEVLNTDLAVRLSVYKPRGMGF